MVILENKGKHIFNMWEKMTEKAYSLVLNYVYFVYCWFFYILFSKKCKTS